jgi:multicomponent K+:H+ antiporter subunit C
MLLLLAIFIGTLAGCGTWLLLRPRSFDVVLGLTLISYAVNLFIFAMGRVRLDAVPIVATGTQATLANTSDPLPQALVLTAIVIGFAMTAVLLAIALVARAETGNDHVDGDAGHAAAEPTGGPR